MTVNERLAFIFPGQGSQQVGMLAELSAKWPVVQSTFAAASQVLAYDLWQLIQEGPQDRLNLTENAQPALLAASYAIWQIWQQESEERPAFMAGHSLGEWSALVCAGVLRFEDAIKLVQLRGRYMQEAVPVGLGSMAAIIGLDDQAVREACLQAGEGQQVSAVNFNAPGQVVIAGHAQAVDRAIERCKKAGAKRALPLSVSAPFHTALMQPAADRLAEHIQQTPFQAPSVTVIHNVHGREEKSPEAIKRLMVQQIYSPVLWVDCVNALADRGVSRLVECGPGKVLGGMVKRINKNIASFSSDAVDAFEQAIQSQS